MRKLTALIAGTAVAGAAWAAQAETWDMPTPYGDTNFHTVNITQFAEDVKAATDGALEITVHPGGSLIEHKDIKNAVRDGEVPIGEFLLSRLSNENPVFEVDSVPFLATDYAAAEKLWAASRPEIETLLAEQDLMVLFAVPWPPQGLYAAKEVQTVDDLKGVKFRAYNAATETIARLAGAVPTQVEVPDIPQAFTTGRVEAMITSPSTGANTKAWDFVSHFYHLQAWLPKNVTVVNKSAFEALPEDQQAAVREAATKAEQRGWEASKAETEAQMKVLADNGMTVVADPSDKLVAGFEKIGETMTQNWVEQAGAPGKAILDAYRE